MLSNKINRKNINKNNKQNDVAGMFEKESELVNPVT